ncbi:MAG: alkyl hydroperoxide reductase, partial [Alphaproteobacteria bacterium]|nr:alkyl hydroperoxide reductase [Alphaproteobacteria bacterium]
MRYTNIAVLSVMILSSTALNAQAQEVKGLHKHDSSIAQYNYSIPIIASDSPGGGSLKDDIDGGRVTKVAPIPQQPFQQSGGQMTPPISGSARAQLAMNSDAPDFALPMASGGSATLHDLLAKGPALVLFTRSVSSAPSQKALQIIQKNLAQFQAIGVQVVAITADSGAALRTAQQKYGFMLLSDANGAVASQYGVKPMGNATLYSISADGKIAGVQANPAMDLNQATLPLRGEPQAAITAPAMAQDQQPSADAMIQAVPGEAPVATLTPVDPSNIPLSPDNQINQVANDPAMSNNAAPV